jgi:thioredoxin 2
MAIARDARVEVRCPACGARNRVPATAAGSPRCGHCHAPLPWTVAADDATFDAVATEARLPILVDLWAPWCGPCRMVAPAVEQLATELAGRLKVVKVNVDEAPGVATRFGARSIPTLLVLSRGATVERIVGALPAAALGAKVRAALQGIEGRP